MKKKEYISLFLACVLLALMLAGCRGVKVVTEVQHDTIYRTRTEYQDRVQRDSVYVYDSVMVYQRGDTIYRDRWHVRESVKESRDTLYKTDTLYRTQYVEKVAEKPRKRATWWIWLCIGAGAAVVIYALLRFKPWRR